MNPGRPLSLYIHFPWCARKCPYCDFNSHPQKGELPEQRYIEKLLEDLAADLLDAPPGPIDTIFLGGGTPSLFSSRSIATLLEGVRSRMTVNDDAEITLEANPGTVDEAHFDGYLAAGVNRLSIGAQTFSQAGLERLGRIHGPAEIERAVVAAHNAGFSRINLDLMHGLPEQSIALALEDIDRALALGVEHLSWYQLTIEPRTAFASDPPTLPPEDTLAQIESEGLERLTSGGLERYEISAYARHGAQARHNLNYWRFGDYIGIGAGAHGKWTSSDGPVSVTRTSKPLAPERYLSTPTTRLCSRGTVSREALPGEFMLNVLRLVDGVETSRFGLTTGLPLDTIAAEWRRQAELGLMRDDRIALTEFGRRHLDSVVVAFL